MVPPYLHCITDTDRDVRSVMIIPLVYIIHTRQKILYFDCCVAKAFWEHIAEVCGNKLGTDFESVDKF
jgi:hypothetical protein